MAVFTNGKAGKADYPPYAMNQHDILERARREKKRKQKGWIRRLFSGITRLLVWYSIATILFRCPSEQQLLTDASPKVCKLYLPARDTIVPHLEPYYDAYASPYVEKIRPYYNTVDKNVLTPAIAIGKKYGAPRISQAQDIAYAQWTKTVEPQLSKFGNEAKQQYDQVLAPYVGKAAEAVGPYYGAARGAAIHSYYENVLPAYNTVKPHALYAYGHGSDFVVNTGIPYTKWAWTSGAVFVERKVWPRVRILYGENVEPQLIRIGERLGRYRDGKKLKAAIDDVDVSATESLTIQTIVPTSSAFSASATIAPSSTPVPSSNQGGEASNDREEIAKNAKAVVAEDLKKWQERFSKAADEGADELEERVTEITDRFIKSQARGVGEALIIELEETVKSQIKSLQKTINSIAERAPENSEEELTKAIRKAGATIKDKAQAARNWRQGYDEEIDYLVSESSKETFDIIDNIRELGLAEIGRRWAWTDGITHKDWKKYHALKDKFNEWRQEVEDVITKHPGLAEAHAAGEDIESRAMHIGAEASQELIRLKDVGKWKIATGDSSDDFSTKIMPAVVENAAQKVMEKIVGEPVSETPTGAVESLASAASEAASIVRESAASLVGVAPGTAESLAPPAAESVGSVASEVSSTVIPSEAGVVEQASESAASKIWGGAEAQFVEARQIIYDDDIVVDDSEDHFSLKIQSMASEAGDRFADVTKAVSEALLGTKTTQGSMESVTSLATEQYSKALRAASEVMYGTPQGTGESVASVAASRYSEAVSAASAAIYGTPTPFVKSVVAEASERLWPTQGAYESISSVASAKLAEGLSAASAQYASVKAAVGATPTPASEKLLAQAQQQYYVGVGLAHERYSEFVAAASAAIMPTPSPTPFQESISAKVAEKADSFASAASINWENVVSAASVQVYGKPTPVYESMYSQAGEYVSQAGDYASQATDGVAAQYEAVQALISELVVGKEPDFTESVYSRFSSAYHTAAPAAYASAAAYASENAASAMSYGSETYESASAAVVSAFTPPAVLEDLIKDASAQLDAAVEAASAQIYGTTTATGYAEAASASAASVYSAASEAIYGHETGYAESISIAIYGSKTGYVESATKVVVENFAAATEAVGDLYEKVFGEEEKGAVESARGRLGEAVESAKSRLEGLVGKSEPTAEAGLKEKVDEVWGSVTATASAESASASASRKDEL